MTERSFSSARGRVVAALVGVGLLLSACQGGGPTPGTSPSISSTSTSPSATPTASPTPSAKYVPASAKGKAQNVPVPVKPALADQNSKAGLEAFTKYWFALLDYAHQTGDLKEWKSVTSTGCTFCTELGESIEIAYQDGRWTAGGKFTIPSAVATIREGNPTQQVVVQVIQSKVEYFDADGSVGREATPASNSASVLVAKYANGTWSVTDVGFI